MSKSGEIKKSGITYSFSIDEEASSISVMMIHDEIMDIVNFTYPPLTIKGTASYNIGYDATADYTEILYPRAFNGETNTFEQVAIEAVGITEHLEQ